MEEQKALTVCGNTALDPNLALKRKDVASALFASGLYPNAKNPAGAFAIVQYGAELGMGPMVSLQNINIIQGKPAANAQTMLALAQARGTTFAVVTETETECTIKFKKGSIEYESTFTLKDAEDAGLTGKENWKKYRKDMLFWRAVAKGVRRIDPAAVMGLYTPDELTDGEVVDVANYKEPAKTTVTAEVMPEEPTVAQVDFHDETIEAVSHATSVQGLTELFKRKRKMIDASPFHTEIYAAFAKKKAELQGEEAA